MSVSRILGFGIRTDLAYDLEHHLWVDATRGDRVRVGLDPLGVETSGTLAQLVLEAPGADTSGARRWGVWRRRSTWAR
jgi:glycine cleavage system H lipoate-binding protein